MGNQLTVDASTEEPAIRFCINAFTTEAGVEEYAPPNEDDPSLRWNIYARDPDGGTPSGVDLSVEGDYGTYALARAAAEDGCRMLGLDPADIRVY